MHEIICPHCGKAFKIDEAGYADILKQVRDRDFEQQLHERLELAERDKQNAVELAKSRLASELQKASDAIDPEVMDRIMRLPRAKELKNWQPPEPPLKDIRNQYGANLSDDDLLLRYIIGSDDDIKVMHGAGSPSAEKYLGVATPLRALIGELLNRRDLSQVSIHAKDVQLSIER